MATFPTPEPIPDEQQGTLPLSEPVTLPEWRDAAEVCRTELARLVTNLCIGGDRSRDDLWRLAESLEPTIAIVDKLARREGR